MLVAIAHLSFFISCLPRDKNKWQQLLYEGSLLKINETHALFRAVSAARIPAAATDPVLLRLIGGSETPDVMTFRGEKHLSVKPSVPL